MKFSERVDARADGIVLAANRIFNGRPEVWRAIDGQVLLLRGIAADLRVIERAFENTIIKANK